ncbi:hypothetical protein BHE74_00028673 [Ensete ventricosum]|nr:hypothetical protein BHE74_00028673 [Ensete ventricosum]
MRWYRLVCCSLGRFGLLEHMAGGLLRIDSKPHFLHLSRMLLMARLCIPFEGARKRRRGEQSFGFDSFCDTGNFSTHLLTGSFQDKLKALLMFAHPEAVAQGELQCHSFQLELHRHPPTSVRLFVLEEDVGASTCRRCRYCVSVGTVGTPDMNSHSVL